MEIAQWPEWLEEPLDPLDIDLRRYIIHYGERAQAAYDTFNSELASKYAGGSLYAREHLFKRVGLDKGNPFKYEAKKYFYATSGIAVPGGFILKPPSKEAVFKESNWMGYLAVTTDEGKAALGRRDILIAWRGTVQPIEWVKDFQFPLVLAPEIVGKADARVHQGFLSIYTSANPESDYNKTSVREQVIDELTRQLEEFKDEETSISICGHSLGAALSTLTAIDIVAHGYNNSSPVTAFAFGSPRVGDSKFKEAFQPMKNLHLLRVCNAPDVVPYSPPFPYTHVGEELLVDSQNSGYLKFPGHPVSWHDLEAGYLHSVAGTQGTTGGFHLEVKRDITLINKYLGELKSEYMTPPDWRCLENKGMVQQDNGNWKLEDHDLEID